MYYGMQLAASGILTSLYRSDVAAANLANIETTGFKPELAFARQRKTAREEDGLGTLPSDALLERLGAGVHMAPNQTDHSQGPLKQTGNDLDLAIRGDGFFVLRDASDGATDAIRLTRDGRFTIDADRRLVSATTGMPVVDASNRDITLSEDAPVQITADGGIYQLGEEVARLQLIDMPDRTQLTKVGNSLYIPSSVGYANREDATGMVEQGMLEGAAINEISGIMGFQAAARSVGSNTRMVQYHDQMMNSVINTFARTT